MKTYYRGRSGVLQLGAELGAGGEATVYGLAGDPSLAAKIYRAPTGRRAAKLRAMLANPPHDPTAGTGHSSIAWPRELVCDEYETPIGFLMPRLDLRTHWPVLVLYNPQARLEEVPGFTWEYLLRTGANLASVVAALHAQGYVVGDLNESNLLVSNAALVTLLDCDSLQVPSPAGPVFRCPVGKPEYTPPELQGRDFATVDRAPAHDNFGLAVLIFLLLMEGVHPFMGVWPGAGNPPTLEANIAAGRCPYLEAAAIPPPPYALPFTTLPPPVQALLRRCFGPGHHDPAQRPGPAEWRDALEAAAAQLVTCPANRQHRYSAHLGADCPWCARMRRLHIPDPFPLPGAGPPARGPGRRGAAGRAVAAGGYGAARRGGPGPAPRRPAPPAPSPVGAQAGSAFIFLYTGCFALLVLLCLGTGALSIFARPATALLRTPSPALGPVTPRPAPTLVVGAPVIAGPVANGRLAFVSTRNGVQAIYSMNPDGSGLARLTNQPTADREPAWSPDGHRLAFVSLRDGNSQIYLMNADGSGQAPLTKDGARNWAPAWSPDGRRIAYTSTRVGSDAVFVVDVAGGPPLRLTENTGDYYSASASWHPAWSPDGRALAFTYQLAGASYRIAVLNVGDGSFTYLSTSRGWDPAWSPDGTRLAYVSDQDGHPAIYLMDGQGRGLGRFDDSPLAEQDPAWSPDGRELAFVANGDLYVGNAAGGGARTSLTHGSTSGHPAWGPRP